jgi:hypothetical protein
MQVLERFCFVLVYTSWKFVFLKMLLVRTKPLPERSGTYVYHRRACHVQQKDQKVLTFDSTFWFVLTKFYFSSLLYECNQF